MKVLLEIEDGFAKEIFSANSQKTPFEQKLEIKHFLQGYKDILPMVNTASTKEKLATTLLHVLVASYETCWVLGAIARLENDKGTVKVVE